MKTKKLLITLLCVLFVLPCVLPAAATTIRPPAPDSPAFDANDFLTAQGRYLVNRYGDKIQLKGVNLGAWMIWEDWLNPYEEASDHYEVLTTLTERFGEEKAYELMNIYMDNFITEWDLDNIKSMGFNCVRVPFWFRNFYYDDNGRKILDDKGDWDFSRLDWVVEECGKRGLYVILDMHGAVGYQSDAPHSGKGNSVGLYADTAQGERYRELTDELWTAIATRFRDNPTVAMYDLLNEPMCDVPENGLVRRINNEKIYTRLYNTVRAVDPYHAISVECIWTPLGLPHKQVKGWKNVVYQVHFYETTDFVFSWNVLMTRLWYLNTPLLMGEFYPHKQTTWENCFKKMNQADFSWMLWTYKATGHGMWDGDWCLFGSKDGFWRAKVKTDSFEDIAYKWGERQQTQQGFQDSGHYERDVKAYL